MKKLSVLILGFCLWLCMAAPRQAAAETGSAFLTGPETVRAGDTVTLVFSLSGNGLYGASGTLVYDSAQLTLVETEQIIPAPWTVEFNGANMLAYDDQLSSPIEGRRELFRVSFRVKELAAGTGITVSLEKVLASDGKTDTKIGTVPYRATVAAPSDNNRLASLSIGTAGLSPAFRADVTDYTAEVPFSVSRLDAAATPEDGKATVRIESPELTPDGTTDITVTVTSESGARRVYTIRVHRAGDPQDAPSSNNALAGITVEGFSLSPSFRPDQTEYVVWLPYETESVTVSGTAEDEKATVRVTGGTGLVAGKDNCIEILCTAEDGTVRVYTVIARRAAAPSGGADASGGLPAGTAENGTGLPTGEAENQGGVSRLLKSARWLLLPACLVFLAAGVGIGIMIWKKRS